MRSSVSIYARRKDCVLLVKRGKNPFRGHWSLPGGALNPGETPEEASQRELAEETGLVARQFKFLTNFENEHRDEETGQTHHVSLRVFEAIGISGNPAAMDDAEDAGWFSLEQIRQMKTTPGLVKLLDSF